MTQPDVTVVIGAYEAMPYLVECLASVEAQTLDHARIEARIAQLAGNGGEKGDEAEATRDGLVDVAKHEEIARLRAEWNDAYWRSFGFHEHRVISGAEPRLYDCFNVSDAMVSDISSVVSDFIASGKPYAVSYTHLTLPTKRIV